MAKLPHSPSDQQGFAEGQAKSQTAPEISQRWILKVAPDGRFVIPAAARAAMELGDEGKVTAYVEDGELRVISPRAAIKRIQAYVKAHDKGTGSVVDEFIAERHAAAERGD